MPRESKEKMKRYKVHGSGEIHMSQKAGWECGDEKDGILYISKSRFLPSLFGGVLGKETAIELAKDIFNIYGIEIPPNKRKM